MSPKKRTGDVDSNIIPKKPKEKADSVSVKTEPLEQEENVNVVARGFEETASGGDDDAEIGAESSSISYKNEGEILSGEVLFCGATNWDLVGREQPPTGMKNGGGPNLWSPHRIQALKGIQIRTVVSGCTSAHSVAITDEGKVYVWGRNENGQLGLGHTDRQDTPQLIEALQWYNIVAAACGRNHTLFLTENGKVLSCGENKMGQLGHGNQSEQVLLPTQIRYKGPPVRRISCGGEFSVMADKNGNMYSFGCTEYGQLGHKLEGKCTVKSNNTEFQCENAPRLIPVFVEKHIDGQVTHVSDINVREISCGANHTLITDSKKRVFSWGFGGYGRLGHPDPKDEMVPRLLKFFDGPKRGVVQVAAGSTYSLAVNDRGALYFWGQTRPPMESNIHPRLVEDLFHWAVSSVGTSNRSIVVAADDTALSWGTSPSFGELGYGEECMKSSRVPKEIQPLEGICVLSVSCGFSHTLFIVCSETEEELKALEKLPTYTP